MTTFLNLLASGIAMGAIFALGAAGLLLLYKASGAINFAQGDLMTVGAYLSYWCTVTLALPIPLAYALTLGLVFCLGIVLERIAYAPIRNRSMMAVVLSTLGAGMALRAVTGIVFGTVPLSVPGPVSQGALNIGGFAISYQRILIIGACMATVAVMWWVFDHTQLGRQVRTLAADIGMAKLLGIRVRGLSSFAFGMSALLAGLAGLLLGPLAPLTTDFGFSIMLGSFAAATLGGFGNLGGAVVAGLLLGVVSQVLGGYVFTDISSTYPFIIMIAVIAIRPRGLFAGESNVRL